MMEIPNNTKTIWGYRGGAGACPWRAWGAPVVGHSSLMSPTVAEALADANF